MSRSLPIDVSDLARTQIAAADEWWCTNRPKAPQALQDDVQRASALIARQAEIGALARNLSLPGVRRLHLARIRYDLYYRIVGEPQRVEVLALWHASRGSNPPL